jgi:succinoglycan biosynthesis protein ExoM
MTPIVTVAALTYKRPEGVKELLQGLAALHRPEGWQVRFLIVDNDPEQSARATVSEAGKWLEGLHYVAEPEPGIPAARNRALDEASASGAALLCFLDDDETPEPYWLAELVAYWRATGVALIGGPLRRTLWGQPRSALHRWFAHSLVARRTLAERLAASRAAAGKPVPVYTSNWMCALEPVREVGLSFDRNMRFSGGSDYAFYRAALELGLPTGWCANAIVSEPIAQDRLSIRYQYRRSRDQGIVAAQLEGRSGVATLLRQAPRAVAGLGLLVLPVFGVASFATGLQLIASAAGHLAWLRGRQSSLYERSTLV